MAANVVPLKALFDVSNHELDHQSGFLGEIIVEMFKCLVSVSNTGTRRC